MKTISIPLLFAVLSLPLQAALFMVGDEEATVYLDGRSTGTLSQGEIIAADWLPDEEFVSISRNDRTFKVRRNRLVSRDELETNGKKQALEREAAIRNLRQDRNLLLAERLQLARLAIETERDLGVIVVFPGVRVSQVPTTTVTNSRYGRSVQMVPRITVQPEEVATLTERQARRVHDKIRERREIIDAQLKASTDGLVRAAAADVAANLRRQRLLDRYQLFPDDYLRETFIVLADRAAVYRDLNAVGELRRHQVVSGTRSPRDPEWITIDNFEGSPAKIRATHLGAEQQLLADNAAERQQITLAIELAESEIELQLARKATIQAARNELETLIERRDQFVELDPDDLARRRDERVLPVPVGAIESANVHQAKKQIREFEKQMDALNPALNDTRNRSLQLRQRLVDLEAREQMLKAAFSAKN